MTMRKAVEEFNLYVPGRISLVGELSDWTYEFMKQNDNIVPGMVLVSKLDMGIFATVKRSNHLKFYIGDDVHEWCMEDHILKEEATSASFYSYLCGTALHMKRKYSVQGIILNIRHSNLPINKGLSSSAAICVLVARAFNCCYHLNLSDNEIMEDAYQGEHLANSPCGKLDQIVAKSTSQLSKMTFYENCIRIDPLEVKKELNLVIVDLMSHKDTRKILNSLRSCYPIAKNKQQKAVHELLGSENQKLVCRMEEAIENGELSKIGAILNDAQNLIDKNGIPICNEFKAPLLHKVKEDSYIKKRSYGSKGVGSGGDGSLQILAKDKKSQQEIADYLEQKLRMKTYQFDIKKTHKVKKAIIPVAGFGTRMYPFTRAINKAFIPINDHGTMKPIILKLIEELDQAGIEEICLIIAPDDKPEYDAFFGKYLPEKYLDKMNSQAVEYDLHILKLGTKISYVIQNEQKGFGHAVSLGRKFAGNDPVLVVLGDTYYTSNTDETCADQILTYYDEVQRNIIGIQSMSDNEIENVGILSGVWNNSEQTKMTVKELVEKPKLKYAKDCLQMDGVCYGNFGMWIINRHVFNQIEYNIDNEVTSGGEFQFVDAIAQILDDIDVKALKIDGTSHDIGNYNSYKKSLVTSFLSEDSNVDINSLSDTEILQKIQELLSNREI